jgi:hypothetical protein
MGYSINRFAKDSVSEEFVCHICKDVLKDPLLVDSCEHIFCKDCIHRSIELEEKCPIDKNNVTFKQLREPIRSFKNLLAQLQINCEFSSLGCKQTFRLDQIETHTKTCTYGPPDRNKLDCICGLKVEKIDIEEHQSNCVTTLQKELSQWKSSLEELKQKEKLKKTENHEIVKTFFDEWISCGKEVKVVKSDMSAEKKLDAITLIKDGLNSNDVNFLKKLTLFFNQKYGFNWYALVFEAVCAYKYNEGNYLLLSIGHKRLRLFRTLTLSLANTIKEARTVAKPQIVKNTMKILMLDDAIAFSSRALFVGENILQIASLIRERFTEKYKNNWNCLITADNFGLSYTPKQQTLVNLKFADLFVVIWQCP